MKMASIALALLLLTGCAAVVPSASSPEVSETPTARSTASAPVETPTGEATQPSSSTPSPSAVPSSTPAPTASDPVITTAGYGDLKIDRPVPAGTTLVRWDPDFCTDYGMWVPTRGEDDFVVYTGEKDETIGALTFRVPGIFTKSGAHVGSTVRELKQLFPGIEPVRRISSDLYIVSDHLGKVIFEVAPAELEDEWQGYVAPDTVAFITVISSSEKAYATAFSDIGHTCVRSE